MKRRITSRCLHWTSTRSTFESQKNETELKKVLNSEQIERKIRREIRMNINIGETVERYCSATDSIQGNARNMIASGRRGLIITVQTWILI